MAHARLLLALLCACFSQASGNKKLSPRNVPLEQNTSTGISSGHIMYWGHLSFWVVAVVREEIQKLLK